MHDSYTYIFLNKNFTAPLMCLAPVMLLVSSSLSVSGLHIVQTDDTFILFDFPG